MSGIRIVGARPSEITKEKLQEIRGECFDDFYLGISIKFADICGGASYYLALDGNTPVGYNMYFTPNDASYQKIKPGEFGYNLMWRYLRLSGLSISETPMPILANFLRNNLNGKADEGVVVDGSRIKTFHSFSGLGLPALPNDIYDAEIAVLPEYRGKGIGTRLAESVLDEKPLGSRILARVRVSYNGEPSTMYKIMSEIGFIPLFQYGPYFPDGSSYVLMAKI